LYALTQLRCSGTYFGDLVPAYGEKCGLVLEEILLAGCPTVGVRTGASFVRPGIIGLLVDRLPPGHEHVANADGDAALATCLDTIRQAQDMDRHAVPAVPAAAADEFATDRIADVILTVLNQALT